MPTYTETFVDTSGTNLEAHTGPGGVTWVKAVTASVPMVISPSGRLRSGGAGTPHLYRPSLTNAAYNQYFEFDLGCPAGGSVGVFDGFQIGLRGTATGDNGYRASVYGGSISIQRVNSGAYTLVSALYAMPAIPAGTVKRFRIEVEGTATVTVRLYIDGTLVLTATDSSGSRITAAGYPHLAIYQSDSPSDSNGAYITAAEWGVLPLVAPNMPATTANLFYLPSGWRLDTAGVAYLETVPGGNSLRAAYAGSDDPASLRVDVSHMDAAGVSAANYPTVSWSYDGMPYSTSQLVPGQTSLTLTGLQPAASHRLNVIHSWQPVTAGDQWTGGGITCSLRVLGFELPAGATSAAPAPRPNRLHCVGDSTLHAALDLGGSDPRCDRTWAFALAAALDAEVSTDGRPGQGYQASSTYGGVPAWPTAFTKYDSTHTKSLTGLTYLVIRHGQNGGTPAATVAAAITAVRAAVSVGTKIAVCVPFTGINRAGVTGGYNLYQLTTPDALAALIDGATDSHFQGPLTQSDYSLDNIHPHQIGSLTLGALDAKLIAEAFTPAPAGGPRLAGGF